MGVLSKRRTEKEPGRQGGCLLQGLLGKSYQGCAFTCDSAGCGLGQALVWEANDSVRPPVRLLAKMDAEAAIP